MADKRFYDEDEAEQILKLASKRMGSQGTVPREQLIATAAELGIPAEELFRAEQEYERTKTETTERREYELHLRRETLEHVGIFVIVNAGLMALDYFKDGHISWAYWPLATWGFALLIGAWASFARGSSDYERAFERWRARRNPLALPNPDATKVLDSMEGEIDVRRERIRAIRELRERTGMDLKDSKEALDAYLRQRGE